MTTDTPRTDAWAFCDKEKDLEYVYASVSRSLERELAESQSQSHGLARRVVEAETMLEVVTKQLKNYTAAIETL